MIPLYFYSAYDKHEIGNHKPELLQSKRESSTLKCARNELNYINSVRL